MSKDDKLLARRWTEMGLEDLFQTIRFLLQQNATDLVQQAERRKLDMSVFDAFASDTTIRIGRLEGLIDGVRTTLVQVLKRVEKLEKAKSWAKPGPKPKPKLKIAQPRA